MLKRHAWVVYLSTADNSIGPKPGTMPHLTMLWRGQCHGLASFLLPTRFVGDHMALRHVACHWVQARPARPTRAGQAQAQAFYRAQSIRGPDAQASLCVAAIVQPRSSIHFSG